MNNQKKAVTLDQLREARSPEEVTFSKCIMGGYDIKEVNEYILTLKERLHNAETSYQNRLDEFTAMSAMIAAERDDCKNKIRELEASNASLRHDVEKYINENHSLHESIQEISENTLSESEKQSLSEVMNRNNELEEMLKDFDTLMNDNKNLTAALSDKTNNEKEWMRRAQELEKNNKENREETVKLQRLYNDLKTALEDYEKNFINKEFYFSLLYENEQLNNLFDAAVSEKNRIEAEKNGTVEQNRKLSEKLIQSGSLVSELKKAIIKQKQEKRCLISSMQVRMLEYSDYHKQNMDQLYEYIGSISELIQTEKENAEKLLSAADNHHQVTEQEDMVL